MVVATRRPWAAAVLVGLLGATSCQAGGFLEAGPAEVSLEVLESQQLLSKVDELNSQTLAAVAEANAAAADSSATALRAQRIGLQNEVELARVKRAIPEAKERAGVAASLSQQVAATVQGAEAYAKKEAIERAEDLAVKAVQGFFIGKYQELEPWRASVLKDPFAAGRLAAAAAAEPHKQAAADARTKAKLLQDQATSLAGAIEKERNAATQLSKAAGMKLGTGDEEGSRQDMEMASSLRHHVEELTAYVQELKAEAKKLTEQAPRFDDLAHTSAFEAEQKENPEALPPLPLDPNIAYTPPPPQ